jgi:hypothetical protein
VVLRPNQKGFLIVTFTGGILLVSAFAFGGIFEQPSVGRYANVLPGSPRLNDFGNPPSNYTGWLLPSDTLVSTTFVANKSMNQFVSGIVNVFPYQTNQGGILTMGLYINGDLSANQTYVISQSVAQPATIQNSTSGDYARFSHSLSVYTVTLFMHSTLPVGTAVTITIHDTGSLWVQTGGTGSVASYANSSVGLLPKTLPMTNLQETTPYPLSIQVEADA